MEDAKIEEYNPIDGKFYLITKDKVLLAKTWDKNTARIIANAFDKEYESRGD